MFKKKGYSTSPITQLSKDAVLADPIIVERMTKLAYEIKSLTPRSEDFLYFSIIFLKSAESSLLDDAGDLKKVGNERAWGYFDEGWKWHGNVKPHKNNNCFVAGTKILMADCSTKNIEDIVTGDFVITHAGESKKVLTTTRENYVGDLLTLNVRNKESVSCTPEHPFYSVQYKNKRLRLKKDSAVGNISFSFNEASSLDKGSFLTSPITNKFVNSNMTPGLARLLGIFAAEGSYTKKYGRLQGLLFTIGDSETEQAETIKKLAESEFPGCSVRKNYSKQNSTISITVTGSGIAKIFYDNIGEYSHQKKISADIVFGTEDVKKQFLIGWLDGDGCLTRYNKIIGITTSPHIAYQAHMMLNSLRISSSLKSSSLCKSMIAPTNGKTYSARKHYRLDIHGRGFEKLGLNTESAKYKGFFNLTLPSKDFDIFSDNHSIHSVSSIDKSSFNGLVYNFQVEDHNSYVANGLVVHNCDIFPEIELKKAASKWIGMPLCKDHESSSVDGIRGIILDTYYDDKMKQVIGLCALDRVNYADLARKVETGIVRYGSMGTAVETSVCSDCQNFAKTANEYCAHVKGRTAWGEINVGLKPIEYSLVVQPAEPGAILLRCIASLQDYKKEFINYGVDNFDEMIGKLSLDQAQHLNTIVKTACGEDGCSPSERRKIITSFIKNNSLGDFAASSNSISDNQHGTSADATVVRSTGEGIGYNTDGVKDFTGTPGDKGTGIAASVGLKNSSEGGSPMISGGPVGNATPDIADIQSSSDPQKFASQNNVGHKKAKSLISTIMEDIMTESQLKKRAELRRKLAYHQGGSAGVEPTGYKSKPFSYNEDKHMKQTKSMGNKQGVFPGDESTKQKLSRADLEERQMRRVAYYQGGSEKGVEPTGYKSKPFSYNEDKHMKQTKPMGGKETMFPGDEKVKQNQKRAAYAGPALSTKLSWPVSPAGGIVKSAALFEVYAGNKKVIAATGHEIFGNEVSDNWNWFTSKEYGQEVCKQIRASGLNHVTMLLKGAQVADPTAAAAPPAAPPAMPPMPDTGGMPDEGGGAAGMGEEESDEEKKSPKEQVEECLVVVEGEIDKARKALQNLAGGEDVNVNVNVGKEGEEEVGDLKLARSVASQIKTAIAEMNESADELAMIAETYSGANRLSSQNRRELDKIASESLRESSGLLGQSRTLTKMASAISMQFTKVAKVAYAEDMAMNNMAMHDMSMDNMDMSNDYSNDADDADEGDEAGEVDDLVAEAMDLRRFRREQLVVEAAKKKGAKEDPKKDPKKDPKMVEKMKALRAKKEEDDAKDMKAKAKAKAEAKDEGKKKASSDVEISKSAAFRDMVNDAFQTKKAEDDKDSYKIKLRRAYDVAIEMQKKGLLNISKTALDKQVDDIMDFDDRAFEAFKRTVANARTVETVKIASDLGGINVGVGSSTERSPVRTTSEILSLLWE